MTVVATLQAYHAALSPLTDVIRRKMTDAEIVGLVDEVGSSAFADPAAVAAAHAAFKAVHESTPPTDPMQLAVWGQDYMAKRAAFWLTVCDAVVEDVILVP